MTNPPAPGDPSFPLFQREKDARLASLRRRAEAITRAFNSCEGVSCQPCQGAMYSFPSLTLPPAAHTAAEKSGVQPDVFYCLALLEATGISSTPGAFHTDTHRHACAHKRHREG